jgi:3-deoxy-D-manno-octulosonic-acid transferase
MSLVLNFFYLLLLIFISPWLIYKASTTGKYRRGMWRKLVGKSLLRDGDEPCVWFHGVSVGEIHLLRQVVAAFRARHPEWDCVISTTTDTGYDEACKRFPDLHVFYWPLDFSWAVRRALRRVKPSLVVLAEGELWPNFLTAAKDHSVPVAVINARLSPRSLKRYEKISWLARRVLTSVDLIAAQTEDYANAFRKLGVPADRIHMTGSVKYDGVETDRANPRTQELARLFGLGNRSNDLVWIAGSTQEPEEQIVLNIYRRLQKQFSGLYLFLVPRQKDRFGEVARLLERSGLPFIRRSQLQARRQGPGTRGEPASLSSSPLAPHSSPLVLVDTMGELSALWGLADVAFVGGSLDGRRGGQNMIEPAAYGAAVIFGPHVWNFRDTADKLVAAGGAIQIQGPDELEATVCRLLKSVQERERLGRNARDFVMRQQGATHRTIDCLDRLLRSPQKKAA